MSELVPASSVTCMACGRVSMAITRAQALEQVQAFNDYWAGLDRRGRDLFGGPSSIEHYACCVTPRYRRSRQGDCPDGCTISGVVCDELAVTER